MSFLALIRNKGFWISDKMRGGYIRKAYNEISVIDKMDSSDPRIKKHQKKALKELLNRASKETLYYSHLKKSSFKEFPIIDKNVIRNNQNSFISKNYKKENLIQMATSGSTGTPFICYQNVKKKKRVNAEIIYYSEKVGYRIGENLSYIRTIVKQNTKSRFKQFIQNQTLINCMSLDDEGIKKIIKEIRRKSRYGKVTLLGYGSTYTAIKDYATKNRIKRFNGINISGIISGSDMLFDETRNAVSPLFNNAPIVSRYSNEENGVIGQDEGINNVFPINEADYIVEICDDNGCCLEDGKLGRIVVTDLYNYSMPMIRYDTGDMASIKTIEINGRKKRCICDFSGRSVDVIYDTSGKALSPHVVTNYMWSYPDINQYQIIQTQKKQYILKLNIAKSFSREKELRQTLHKLLGTDANISIVKVDEIPVLSSGKRRYIINEME